MDATGPHVALALNGLTKVFEGQYALHDVDLELRKGEVHALLGPNGSGKSTLIKILAGYHEPEPGAAARLHGTPLELGSRSSARRIRFIHQDLGLVSELDAVDNLALGQGYTRRWWLSSRRERAAARRLLAEYEIDVDLDTPVHTLTRAQQSMLAIVRAVGSGLGGDSLLVLDEPTAALPAREVRQLFALVQELRRRGGTVLYVTHRLGEVFEIADRVTVLRDGRRVATRPVAELDHDALVELIVGRALEDFVPAPLPPCGGEAVLEVRGIRGGAVADVSLAVRPGEVVGVSGLVGSGCEHLLQLIFGAERREAGEVLLDGRPVSGQSPDRSIRAGIAFVPADRKRLSAILDWTLRENVTLADVQGRGPAHWMSATRERADAGAWLQRLDVVPGDPERQFSSLSGGNQQKVVVARWLRRGARAFLMEEPTNGVDMGAKHGIYEALVDVARGGAGVLMTSQDPEELCFVCDRVIVLRDGRIGAELVGSAISEDRIVTESVRRTASDTRESRFDAAR